MGELRTSAVETAGSEAVPVHAGACASHEAAPVQCGPGEAARRLPWITLKDVLWALYLCPGAWVSRKSLPVLYRILRGVEPVFQLLAARHRKVVTERLALAFGPGMSPSTLDAVARRFIANAVRRAGDDLALLREDAQVRCRSFSGREHLESARAAGKGVLLVSLHWYAGRASNRYLADLGHPVMSVRNEEPEDRFMGRLGRRSLQPRYIRLLHDVIRDEVFIQDRECSLKILRRLRSGGIVDIYLDAAFSRHVIERSFLGRPRRFPAGVLHLARNCGCAVLPKVALGHVDSLEIRIDPPLPLDRGLPVEEFCEAHLPGLIRILESHVLEYPDQWELWTRL
jgi:lauroyl/myristoyl acyltransferase